jgi:hypothetical protein
MMDRELNIFLGLLAFLIVIVGGCTATVNYNDNQSIEVLVKSGSDPIDAGCAIRGSAMQECIVRVATKIHPK